MFGALGRLLFLGELLAGGRFRSGSPCGIGSRNFELDKLVMRGLDVGSQHEELHSTLDRTGDVFLYTTECHQV